MSGSILPGAVRYITIWFCVSTDTYIHGLVGWKSRWRGPKFLPPHGLLLMTMRGVAPPAVTMAHIFRAVVPYIALSLILLVLIILFPAIATWLPALLG